MVISDHRICESPCPSCGKRMDAAANIHGEEGPSPGDVTICIECGAVLTFDDALCLRQATSSELKNIAGDPQFKEVLAAVAALKVGKDTP